MRKVIEAAAFVALVGMLGGCGGGGDDGDDIPTATAEGVYGGELTGSSSGSFQMLILENGEVWAMYGTQISNAFLVAGFIQGTGSSTNGTFSAGDIRDFGSVPALVGSASATYNAVAKTIAGTISASGSTVGFSGGPIAGSLYNYDTPAAVSTITGPWTLTSITGESISLSVAGSGEFTATSQFGCAFSGSIVPRASGKNVFNVQISFGPPPCALANQAASGIAVAYPLPSGKAQLIVAGTNVARTLGTAAFGTR